MSDNPRFALCEVEYLRTGRGEFIEVDTCVSEQIDVAEIQDSLPDDDILRHLIFIEISEGADKTTYRVLDEPGIIVHKEFFQVNIQENVDASIDAERLLRAFEPFISESISDMLDGEAPNMSHVRLDLRMPDGCIMTIDTVTLGEMRDCYEGAE
jgi:hypothetical protein